MNTQEMTDRMREWQQRASEQARNMGQATDQYVRENVWSSIAIAALLGCVLGYMLSSRRERED